MHDHSRDTAPPAPPEHRFRPDIEGLRALAVLAVVLYHAGLRYVPGGFVGVDVFFVISGFLITSLLVSEVSAQGRVSLRRFWARRARRLLPASTLTLAVTAGVGWWVLPVVDHAKEGGDLIAAALYVANMRFASQATDYLQEHLSPSPVLHFWSLGVEEQFYLMWPLLVVGGAWWARRRAGGGEGGGGQSTLTRTLALTLTALTLTSFALSLHLTERVMPWAFFGMPARAWEFAVGGLVALALPRIERASKTARALTGWAGLCALIAAFLYIDGGSGFPGLIALWPVLGTVGVIIGGITPPHEPPPRGVPALLSLGPTRWLGRVSYSWYLWHAPALTLTAAALGPLQTRWKLALALASLLPATLSYTLIEEPIRRARSLSASDARSLRLGLTLSLTGALAGALLMWAPGGGGLAASSSVKTPRAADRPLRRLNPAAPLAPPADLPQDARRAWPAGPLTPSPQEARQDIPVIYKNGCHLEVPGVEPTSGCVFGDERGARLVVLMGDSHAAQWMPALDIIGRRRGWRVLSWTKSGCSAADVTLYNLSLGRVYDECDAWRQEVFKRLRSSPPDLVIVSSLRTDTLIAREGGAALMGRAEAEREWRGGYLRTIKALARLSQRSRVAVIRDTPWPGADVALCVGQHPLDPAACDLPLEALDDPSFDVGLVAGVAGAFGVDMTPHLCGVGGCPATLGRHLVYRDASHLTASCVEALAPLLEAGLVGGEGSPEGAR